MIVQGNNTLRRVHCLSPQEQIDARIFLQSLVDDFLNKNPGASFTASKLVGKKAFQTWKGTPLDPLFWFYFNHGRRVHNSDYAERQAGIAAGYLLKQVIAADSRRFRFVQGYTGTYYVM